MMRVELPESFEKRMQEMLGDEYESYIESYDNPRQYGLRINPMKITEEELAEGSGFSLDPIPWTKTGYFYKEEDQPARHPYYSAGLYYLQEPSAMTPAARFPVEPGERVLDLCAAPGGKATALGAALQGKGVLVANDISNSRAKALLKNLEVFGISNAFVTNEVPQNLAERFEGFFDKVLIDAPCSGEGMFRKDPAVIKTWEEERPEYFAKLQKDILKNGVRMLRPGGKLLYSTCTFAPEEDEGQVAAFLARHPEFALAHVFGRVDYSFGSAGEANRTGGLPLDVSKVRRIWPCQGGEGHFIARLVKAGTPRTLPAPGEYTPEEQLWLAAAAEQSKKQKPGKGKPARAESRDARASRRENARVLREEVQGKRGRRAGDSGAGESASPAQSLAAWHEFAAQYFPALADRPAVVHGGGVLLPVPFPQTGLHVLRAGVFVGSVQKGRFIPEHPLFTAFGARCTNREELTLADPRVTDYLSGREMAASTAADGWCCVTVDGYPLGGGKVSAGRVKNHYPKALRLL